MRFLLISLLFLCSLAIYADSKYRVIYRYEYSQVAVQNLTNDTIYCSFEDSYVDFYVAAYSNSSWYRNEDKEINCY